MSTYSYHRAELQNPLAYLALYANNKWQYLPNKWATEGRGMTQLSKRSGYGMGFEIFASFYPKGIFSFLMSSSLPLTSPKVRKLLKTKPLWCQDGSLKQWNSLWEESKTPCHHELSSMGSMQIDAGFSFSGCEDRAKTLNTSPPAK